MAGVKDFTFMPFQHCSCDYGNIFDIRPHGDEGSELPRQGNNALTLTVDRKFAAAAIGSSEHIHIGKDIYSKPGSINPNPQITAADQFPAGQLHVFTFV